MLKGKLYLSISQLFEGPISDKQIVERSEFLEILGQKLIAGWRKKGEP